MAGKGSRPRPFSVTQQEYNDRWDAIFGRDLDKEHDIDTESTPVNSLDKSIDNQPRDLENREA